MKTGSFEKGGMEPIVNDPRVAQKSKENDYQTMKKLVRTSLERVIQEDLSSDEEMSTQIAARMEKKLMLLQMAMEKRMEALEQENQKLKEQIKTLEADVDDLEEETRELEKQDQTTEKKMKQLRRNRRRASRRRSKSKSKSKEKKNKP